MINSSLINFYVISDLHLAEGDLGKGIYLGTENFFSDESFEKCIRYILDRTNKGSHLIINGDFIDFIRITNCPSEEDIPFWKNELNKVKEHYSFKELKDSISDKEKIYGLKTNDFKCVWKLFVASKGHEAVFLSLAKWITAGNRLIITKGNHDVEWHWPVLQQYLKTILIESIENYQNKEQLYSQIEFKEIIQFNGVHIEHGHQMEIMTRVDGAPTLSDHGRPDELNLPMGSFFNRYFINKVEMHFPYIDNLSGGGKVIKLLFKEKLILALKLILKYGYYLIKVLLKFKKKSVIRFIYHLLTKAIPSIILAYGLYKLINSNEILNKWLVILSLGPITVNMLFKFIFKLTGLLDKDLKANAIELAKSIKGIHTIIVGHNHRPEYEITEGIDYINSGTWVYAHEVSAEKIRNTAMSTVIRGRSDGNNGTKCELMSWNVNTQSLEKYVTIKRPK